MVSMKNEKGLTLIEVLCAIAILGIIYALVSNVLINGMNSSTALVTKQQLQQEANIITETVRTAYLKNDSSMNNSIKLDNSGGSLSMNGQVISTGYEYQITKESIDTTEGFVKFQLTLSVGIHSYEIKTSFSKLIYK